MQAWSDVFGESSCIVRLYEPVKDDIVSDFVEHVLGIGDASRFSKLGHHANERVSRDILEFKRRRNATAKPNERVIERTILRLLEEEMGSRKLEPDQNQDFLSPDGRAALLRLHQPEMEALQESYDIPPFPLFDVDSAKRSWKRYPGLSQQRRQEIQLHYDRINGASPFDSSVSL